MTKTMKEQERPSCYLNYIDIGDGNALLYNGFSACIDVVPSEIAHLLATCREGGDLSFLVPAEKEHLLKRGHLTNLTMEGEQEQMGKLTRAIAKRDIESNMQPFTERMVSFILTYRCNLSCAYCYQDDVRQTAGLASMTEAFVDDFFRVYLDKLFPHTARNKLRFILFGGEPLLPGNRGTIERILGYAKKYGATVSTATNAVMLPAMRDLIGPEAGKIQNVQITLDGEQMFHDRTRIPESGAPTFEDMINAISELIEAKAHANIRIHLHPNGLESTRALVEYLDHQGILGNGNVEVYFAPLHSFHAVNISPSDLDTFSELFHYVTLRQKHPPIQNFDFLKEIMDVKTAGNWSQPRYCAVSAGLHFAVDPSGDIYECLEEAGHKQRRVGTLSGGEVEYSELRETYKGRYLANMPGCLKCPIALFCGGGCISQVRTQGGSVSAQFCAQNKVFVGQTLKACFLLKQAGKKSL
jgi:uncharacterized protein